MTKFKFDFWEFILVFALVIVFVVSMFVAYLSVKANKAETKIDYVERNVNHIMHQHGD